MSRIIFGTLIIFGFAMPAAKGQYGITSAADSFEHSRYLLEKAIDLSVNEQYESAASRATEALKYYRFNGQAYMVRAFANWDQISNNQSKDPATLNSIIEDLNASLKFGMTEPNSNVYRIRGIARNALGENEETVFKDMIEARLAGNNQVISICNDMSKSTDQGARKLYTQLCQSKPLMYNITFSDDKVENAKISIQSDRLANSYKILHLNADKYSVLVVVDFQDKCIWYNAISNGESGTDIAMKKYNVAEFLGDYLNAAFLIKDKDDRLLTSAFPFLEIKVDFAGKKILEKGEYEMIRKMKVNDKPLTRYSILGPVISIVAR